MSLELDRDAARRLLAGHAVTKMTDIQKVNCLDTVWGLRADDPEWENLPQSVQLEMSKYKSPPREASHSDYQPLLELVPYWRTAGVKNRWLQEQLKSIGVDARITGDIEPMRPCPCCGYLTLEERGRFEICLVCFWEDDGTDQPDEGEGPNGLTLQEARKNFRQYGAYKEGAADHVVPDPDTRYTRIN